MCFATLFLLLDLLQLYASSSAFVGLQQLRGGLVFFSLRYHQCGWLQSFCRSFSFFCRRTDLAYVATASPFVLGPHHCVRVLMSEHLLKARREDLFPNAVAIPIWCGLSPALWPACSRPPFREQVIGDYHYCWSREGTVERSQYTKHIAVERRLVRYVRHEPRVCGHRGACSFSYSLDVRSMRELLVHCLSKVWFIYGLFIYGLFTYGLSVLIVSTASPTISTLKRLTEATLPCDIHYLSLASCLKEPVIL